LDVALTKKQIQNSPLIDTHKPVSRQHEALYLGYYGYPYYWGGPFMWGLASYPAGLRVDRVAVTQGEALRARAGKESPDSHLRCTDEVTGYHIEASNGEIGHVKDFLVDDETWAIRYLEVNTRNWWPGKKVLISPRSIESTDWSKRTVNLDVDRQKVKDSPAYDGSKAIDRAYEYQFHGYYDGRRVTEPV